MAISAKPEKDSATVIPVEQEAVWNAVKPRVIEQGRALVELVFCRYKAYYNLIKHDLVAAEGNLNEHPSLSEASLAQNCQRVRTRSIAFDAQLEADNAYFDTVENACLEADKPYSQLIITKTRENTDDLIQYKLHNKPTEKEIDTAYQNRCQTELEQLMQPEQSPGK